MTHFETKAIETSPLKPKLWLRYVDDTFIIWQHGEPELHTFLNHLNSINQKIQFTVEIEEKGTLPFLDILIIKKQDGYLGHKVYRKPTHTNRYLHAESHHHPSHIASVAKSLLWRSNVLSDPDHKREEENCIKSALRQNGFKESLLNKLATRRSRLQEEKVFESTITIPYVKGTSERIGRVLHKYKIRTCFNTHSNIKQLLRSPKDHIPLEGQGVYEIPCGDCDSTYVGQTNRRVSARRNEHILATRKMDLRSSLAQHERDTMHKINFADTKIIKKVTHFHQRTIREAIEIEKRPNSMNKRDDALRMPPAWKTSFGRTQVPPGAKQLRLNPNPAPPDSMTPLRNNPPENDQQPANDDGKTTNRPMTRSQTRRTATDHTTNTRRSRTPNQLNS